MQSRTTKNFLTVLLTILIVLFGMPNLVLAEPETLGMDQMYLDIWPEYDSTDVLVIYTGNFKNDLGKPFQGELRYKVPKDAKINMVCETENGMACQKYIVENKGDYSEVVWKPSRVIQPGESFPVMMEFNYNQFTAAGQREFSYDFLPAYNVDLLQVSFKQPLRSNNFTLTPEAASYQVDNEKFTNYYYQYENITPEDQITFAAQYDKGDNKPSIDPDEVSQASSGVDSAPKLSGTVVMMLVVFIVLLLAVLFFATTRKSSPGKTPKSGKGKPRNQQVSRPKQTKASSQVSSKNHREAAKIRKMLIDGKISEETYKELMADLEDEE